MLLRKCSGECLAQNISGAGNSARWLSGSSLHDLLGSQGDVMAASQAQLTGPWDLQPMGNACQASGTLLGRGSDKGRLVSPVDTLGTQKPEACLSAGQGPSCGHLASQ